VCVGSTLGIPLGLPCKGDTSLCRSVTVNLERRCFEVLPNGVKSALRGKALMAALADGYAEVVDAGALLAR